MPRRSALDRYGHPVPARRESTVVFHDHAFAAGHILEVGVMEGPHRHTQFEINHVLEGWMTYAFDGGRVSLGPGQTAFFFGMAPHQVTACAGGTRFVCLYLPAELVLGLRIGEALRRALFDSAFVIAGRALETEAASFLRWRDDLMGGDQALASIARDEIGARLRRMGHDGWSDGRASVRPHGASIDRPPHGRDKVAAMTRFIADHAAEQVRVADVAGAVHLHPHYAMTLFRQTVGMTISEYLGRHRLDAAQTLLATSEDDIAAIAFSAGFGSLSRFYDAFRMRFGTSPGAFRAAQRSSTGATTPGASIAVSAFS